MRWSICHYCHAEDETSRQDNSIVRIYECHCCWNEYCDKHGSTETRICDNCLEDAYIFNQYKDRIEKAESGKSKSFEVKDADELFKLVEGE